MKLVTYRNLWGTTGSRSAVFEQIAGAGYDGIESILWDDAHVQEVKLLLGRWNLDFRGVLWTRGTTVAEHLASFEKQAIRVAPLTPSGFTVIGGSDCWDDSDIGRYYEGALKVEQRLGVPVAHEIHRNTCLFHPAAARRILARFPEIKLVCDFSHWVVSCERMIHDQEDLIRQCGRQAVHIHSRVGNEQTPQLGDIRAPEARPYLEAFEKWWEIVWEEQSARGLAVTSICPEFGAPPYQQTLPYTGEPVADLAAVCDWQAARQRLHFGEWQAARMASLIAQEPAK
jgi:sugar phosphate isomerase/epimerase